MSFKVRHRGKKRLNVSCYEITLYLTINDNKYQYGTMTNMQILSTERGIFLTSKWRFVQGSLTIKGM